MMGRESGSRPSDGSRQPGVLMNRPGCRRVLERDWGPGRAVRTRQLAMLKRIKIPGR